MMISREPNQSSSWPRSSIIWNAARGEAEHREAIPGELQLGRCRRLAHEQRDADDGEDAERQVDVEHPAPGVEVGQVAAECRADHRTHGDAHGEDRHRLGAARERIDVQHRRLRQRRQRGAEHALQQAEAHQLLQRLRRAAQHGGDGEARDADDEQPLAAEADGHPADRGGHDGGGDHVGGEHPGDLVVATPTCCPACRAAPRWRWWNPASA